jgi:hypothetical protein
MSVKSKLRARKAAAIARGDPVENKCGNQRGFQKGVSANPKGRPKGVPNKVTKTVREMIAVLVENNIAGAQALYDRVARHNPAKALELLAKFAEFCLPKLNRTELQLPPPAPGSIQIVTEEDAARAYMELIRNPSMDASQFAWPKPTTPTADPSVVAEVPATPAVPPDTPSEPANVMSISDRGPVSERLKLWERLGK